MYAAKNSVVKMWYTNDYTNTYFGIVETRGLQSSRVEIEPTEADAPSAAPRPRTEEPSGS